MTVWPLWEPIFCQTLEFLGSDLVNFLAKIKNFKNCSKKKLKNCQQKKKWSKKCQKFDL